MTHSFPTRRSSDLDHQSAADPRVAELLGLGVGNARRTARGAVAADPADDPAVDRNPRSRRFSVRARSEEHTSELQSLMRISYAVFCLKKKKPNNHQIVE